MALEEEDAIFIGLFMSFFSFGIYTVIFGLYVKLVRNRRSSSLTGLDWAIGWLYVVTGATVILDAIQEFHHLRRGQTSENTRWINAINTTTSVTMVSLDFVAQLVLIYRCWIIWNKNIWVALPPLVIAFGSAGAGFAVSLSLGIHPGADLSWWVYAGSSWTILSLIVNAIVSGLMIYKIYSVHLATRGVLLSSGRLDLSWVTSMLIESAVVLFVGQLVYVVLYWLDNAGWFIIVLPVTNLYGLCCTIIMVCVAEKRYTDTSTGHCDTAQSVVVLSGRSHGIKSGHDTYVDTSSTARPMKASKGGIEVDIELNTYTDRGSMNPLEYK